MLRAPNYNQIKLRKEEVRVIVLVCALITSLIIMVLIVHLTLDRLQQCPETWRTNLQNITVIMMALMTGDNVIDVKPVLEDMQVFT